MVPIDLLHAGVPQTFNWYKKMHYLRSAIERGKMKYGIPVFNCPRHQVPGTVSVIIIKYDWHMISIKCIQFASISLKFILRVVSITLTFSVQFIFPLTAIVAFGYY